MTYISINPYTEETVSTFDTVQESEIDHVLSKLNKGYYDWRQRSFQERGQRFIALAAALDAHETMLAKILSTEMGKPLHEARREVQKCARTCHYFVEEGPSLLSSVERSNVRIEPIGTILGIMPWNFPYWQALRLAIPVILMGNTCLIKHAPNVPRAIIALQEIMQDVGLGTTIFNHLLLSNEQAADVIADPRIMGVSLTGSERAGRQVASIAGQSLKRVVLELGGSDPFIVCDDADVQAAAEIGVKARFGNAGQVCISAKRFILNHTIAQDFQDHFVEHVKQLQLGDPTDNDTTLGPLARKDIRDRVAEQVEQSIALGAELIYQAETVPEKGWFYPPTILRCANPNAPVLNDEVFGPVATFTTVQSDDDALALANNTPYGLGASIWSRSQTRQDYFLENLEAGAVFVNDLVKSQPELPFGGTKNSGFGRELGVEGFTTFANIKIFKRGDLGG